MVLQMFSKSAMMAEHDALQQENPNIEDDTVTTPSSIVPSTIALLNEYHTLKDKATSQSQGDWSDSSVSMALTSVRMAAQLIPDLLKSAAIMTSAHMALSFEACVVTRQIYWWYAHTGPDLASTLFGFYRQGREAQVFKTYPSLATFVDAIMTYVTATSERSSKKRKTTNGSNMPSLEDLRIISSEMFPFQHSSSSTSSYLLPYIKTNPKQSHLDSIAVAEWCFLDFISNILIVDHLGQYSETLNSAKQNMNALQRQDDNTLHRSRTLIKARAINCGAILQVFYQAFGHDQSIFSYRPVFNFIQSPLSLFIQISNITKDEELASKIMEDFNILSPLQSLITNVVAKDPGIKISIKNIWKTSVSSNIISTWTSKELSNSQPPEHTPSSNATNSSRRNVDRSSQNISMAMPSTLDSKTLIIASNGPFYGQIGVVLREVLNQHRGHPIANEHLYRILSGLDAVQGQVQLTSFKNLDHVNPVRANNVYHNMLILALPPAHLTCHIGLSWILTYMSTGQGFMTQDFVKQTNMMFDCLEIAVSVFSEAEKQFFNSDPQDHKQYQDPRCWGQHCQQLGLHPTVNLSNDASTSRQITITEKLTPYWTSSIQSKWLTFLGPLVDQDPSTFCGPLHSFDSTLTFISGLKLPPFKSGLTHLQLVNNFALLGICQPPSVADISSWISQNRNLGAFAGLQQLGFNLSWEAKGKKKSEILLPWVKSAFQCVYDHLDMHLTDLDKKELRFGVIFVEHLLCKVGR